MKVESNAIAARTDKHATPDPAAPGKAARFRSLLHKEDKHDAKRREQRASLPKKKDDEKATADTIVAQMMRPEFRPITVEKVEAPRPVIEPKIVEGLVREITVITEADRNDVHIQFNSQTLDGLQIKLSKENGNVSLQFVTTSAEVERVLQRNMDQLTQALIQRGVTIGSNRIDRVPEPPAAEHSGSQRSGGNRQQRRQR